MDRRRLRFPTYDGDRLTVRLGHRERQKLRQAAARLGVSESDLVRESVAVVVQALGDGQGGAPGMAPEALAVIAAHMRRMGLGVLAVWAVSFVIFWMGDIKICDWNEGCGPGWPEWLFYATGWIALASFGVLIAVSLWWVLGRVGRRS